MAMALFKIDARKAEICCFEFSAGLKKKSFSTFFSFPKCGLLLHWLITSKLLEQETSYSSQIEDNLKIFPNLMWFFKFRLRKVEICCFKGDAFLLT